MLEPLLTAVLPQAQGAAKRNPKVGHHRLPVYGDLGGEYYGQAH
ncbi:MAG TPA: hypothetical protein V6C72_05080 [Chroococcales cyanobacterium]